MTEQSTSDIRFLDHSHVISAIADGQRQSIASLLDELDRSCLLSGRDATANNGFALSAKGEEEFLQVGGPERDVKLSPSMTIANPPPSPGLRGTKPRT